MGFFDVAFPLNLEPLTYSAPSNLAPVIKPGMLVRAEIKKTEMQGVVIGKAIHPPDGHVKEILGLSMDQPIFNDSMLSLLKWIAGYYIVPVGLAFKSMFPVEAFEKPKKRTGQRITAVESGLNTLDDGLLIYPDANISSMIKESLSKKEYKAYLLHAPSTKHEIPYVLNAMEGVSNAIMLAPEISDIEMITPILKGCFGERVTVLHGKLSKAQKRDVFFRIISGESDIVLGTRLAVFAPLNSVSLIAVLHEHNRSYKNLEGLRYNARDVAVMRGYLEKSTVLLTSTTPSVESFYNTTTGKYTMLKPDINVQRPKIEILNMKTAKKITPYLSKRAIGEASKCIKRKGGVLFLINRKGYSMIQCAECSNTETCPECRIPTVYHRDERLLMCHCCGYTSKLTDTCKRCNGSKLEMIGAGTQRIASDIKRCLEIEPFRIDKDILKKSPLCKEISHIVGEEGLIVGTKIVTGRLSKKETLCLCASLNPDINLHLPDFRSSEFLFQELFNLSEHIKNNGLFIIQTRMPENYVYRHIRKYDCSSYFKEELHRRKSLSYPPFSRLVLISITSRTDISKDITSALKLTEVDIGRPVEVMGPLRLAGKEADKWKILLKSHAKVRLHIYVHNLLKNLADRKRIKIVVDVDPISI